MTYHIPQLNGAIKRIFSVIKEVALSVILNSKFKK